MFIVSVITVLKTPMTEIDVCKIFHFAAEPGLELHGPITLHCLIESFSLIIL